MRAMGVRAAPMPPAQRRATIVAAAIPLLRKHGEDVTTKQIADAAGIAEGTIFRVFADKDSLITAAITQVFDPSPTVQEMLDVDLALPLRERLRAAIEIIGKRLDSVWELMSAMRMMGAPEHNPRLRAAIPPRALDELLPDALMAVIEPDRAHLRVDVPQAARMLRLITFACAHPRITDGKPLNSDEIVDLLLDGIRAHAP